VTPAFDDYKWMNSAPDFSQTSEVNRVNFSLAVQMSARWLRNRNKISQDSFDEEVLRFVDEKFVEAFRRCQFEGRFQRIEKERLTFFLDGAHTKESMDICTNWFKKQIEKSKDVINVLVFNVTGDRDAAAILKSLHSMNFHYVCFTTNIANSKSDNGKCGKFI
jgi:folylpolyglutamate synthase/dihydropteroate synthase